MPNLKDFKRLPTLLRFMIFVLFFSTLVIGLVYGSVQHALRMSANDPQIQIAEDSAVALERGASLSSVVSNTPVDISGSLAPFTMVYDKNGNLLASSAFIDGKSVEYPRGVLGYAARFGQRRITWQPRPGVRIASVVQPYGGTNPGFVVSGRNIHEVENREVEVFEIAVLAWLGSVLGSLILGAILL
jgi:hypothetical protein